MSLSFVFSNYFILLVECWQYIAYFMPCHVSVDLLYAVSPSSFPFPPLLLFRFFKCRPCFPVLSVHCWPSYFVFLSLPYLTPPPLLWLGVVWGCADTSDPPPVIGRWPLSWHSTTNRTPPSTHADVVKICLKFPPTLLGHDLTLTHTWPRLPSGSLRTTKVAKQGPSANSPVKDLKDLSAMDAFRSRSISVSEHAVRR